MNVFVKPQFSYCTLPWTFHSSKFNSRINWLHERSLSVIYSGNEFLNFTSCCNEFLEVDNSVSVHHWYIQVLATGLWKVVNALSLQLVINWFKSNNMTACNTRNKCTLYSRSVHRVLPGTEYSPAWNQKLEKFCQKPFNTHDL